VGDKREVILKAAERLFSRSGFDGVSIRDIAAEAGVNSALIGYYHGTKESLYRSLFADRYALFNEERLRLLGQTELVAYDKQCLAALVQAWSKPLLQLLQDESNHDFIVLLSRESGEGSVDRHHIVRQFFDPAARSCMAAMGRVYPHLQQAELALYYLWIVTPVVNFIANTQRAARLAEGRACNLPAAPGSIDRLLTFITEGLHAAIMLNHRS
jgi:AcrR family transcriptional regulator